MGSRQRLRSTECVSPSLACLAATVLGVPPSLRLFSSRTHAPCGGVAVRIAPGAVCMSVRTRAHLTAGCWFLLLSWLGCFPRYAQQLPKVDNIWEDFAARNLIVEMGAGETEIISPPPVQFCRMLVPILSWQTTNVFGLHMNTHTTRRRSFVFLQRQMMSGSFTRKRPSDSQATTPYSRRMSYAYSR